MSTITSLCLFLFFSLVVGVPLHTRDVSDPAIISPNASTIWTVGKTETVTWNATGIAAGAKGQVMLGFLTSDSENLSQTLASGFNLSDEKVDITVPNVVTRKNYIIALFGDSGNISPEFTIMGGSSSASASESSGVGTSSTSEDAASNTAKLSVTPSPPIATASSITAIPPPASTPTAPPSLSTSAPGSSSSSSSIGSSAGTSPSPSSTTSAGSSMNKLTTYQVLFAPAVLLLLL